MLFRDAACSGTTTMMHAVVVPEHPGKWMQRCNQSNKKRGMLQHTITEQEEKEEKEEQAERDAAGVVLLLFAEFRDAACLQFRNRLHPCLQFSGCCNAFTGTGCIHAACNNRNNSTACWQLRNAAQQQNAARHECKNMQSNGQKNRIKKYTMGYKKIII